MKKMWLSSVITASVVFLLVTVPAAGATSGVLFSLNAFYTTDKVEVESGGVTSTVDAKDSAYDVKLGYLSNSGLYWGGLYTSRSSDIGGSTSAGTATGASLGYVGSRGFYVMGHYLLSATAGDNYKEGSGMQVDLGYMSAVSGGLILGVELTYRSVTYKKDETNAALDHYKHDEVMPMLTLGYLF